MWTHHFCLYLISQNLGTLPYITAKEPEKHFFFFFFWLAMNWAKKKSRILLLWKREESLLAVSQKSQSHCPLTFESTRGTWVGTLLKSNLNEADRGLFIFCPRCWLTGSSSWPSGERHSFFSVIFIIEPIQVLYGIKALDKMQIFSEIISGLTSMM